MRSLLVVVVVPILLPALVRAAEPDAKAIQFFESKIRPVLVQHCYECHSSNGKQRSGLALDTRDALRKGGDSGPAVVPGKASESLLVQAIRHESLKMPPKAKLPDYVIADFESWIKQGAADPREAGKEAVKYYVSIEEGRRHWAFQAPKKVAPPVSANKTWPKGDIDRFVLAGLEAKTIRPVADAEPWQLARRLHFDLTGLPPTLDEITAFEKEFSANANVATAALVDRLLASSHFGERWGRLWLDLVRYAESGGGMSNLALPGAWHYRDYVIRAFNADKPYSQFLVEQLAGDLLPAADDADRREKLIATGFYTLGITEGSHFDRLEEQMSMIGNATLGLTVACARCHDHKFDPIPQRDYYALSGIFFNTNQKVLGNAKGDAPRYVAEGGPGAKAKGRVRDPVVVSKPSVEDLIVHIRGNETDLGDTVKRGLLQVLLTDPPPAISAGESGRKQFAESLVRPDHPLTSRILVNRVWARLFGRGLVSTVDNFGHLGEKPSHPELLDYLAVTFQEDGWSIKKLIRRLVLSKTYALGSGRDAGNEQLDPDNVLLWKHSIRRLDAEEIRDGILCVGGNLDIRSPGGALSAAVKLGFSGVVKTMPTSSCRSVYLPIIRFAPHDFQEVFDFPDPSLSVGKRENATVPTQALYFLNHRLVMDQAAALAKKIVAGPSDDRHRLEQAYLTIMGRKPAADEVARDLGYLSRSNGAAGWPNLCHALLASVEFRFVR